MSTIRLNVIAHKPPIFLAGLTLLAILGFALVSRLVQAFDNRTHHLAAGFFQSGQADLRGGQTAAAVAHFHAALDYDRGNDVYQFNLAQALFDAKHFDEAEAYLLNLWDRAPQDGEVNLELARLAVIHGANELALRYYHNAIYGIWDDTSGDRRRVARFELVDLLLQHGNRTQAQAELMASVSSAPSEPALRARYAQRFLQAQDYTDALAQYRIVLQHDPRNGGALVGAGEAAFQLGEYRSAERFLKLTAEQDIRDPLAAEMLHTATLVLDSDPFRRNLSGAQRRTRIVAAFEQAGARLQTCAQSKSLDLHASPATDPLQQLNAEWAGITPRLPRSLERESDLADQVMDLAFRIEQQTEQDCGAAQGLDLALLLLGRSGQGVER